MLVRIQDERHLVFESLHRGHRICVPVDGCIQVYEISHDWIQRELAPFLSLQIALDNSVREVDLALIPVRFLSFSTSSGTLERIASKHRAVCSTVPDV